MSIGDWRARARAASRLSGCGFDPGVERGQRGFGVADGEFTLHDAGVVLHLFGMVGKLALHVLEDLGADAELLGDGGVGGPEIGLGWVDGCGLIEQLAGVVEVEGEGALPSLVDEVGGLGVRRLDFGGGPCERLWGFEFGDACGGDADFGRRREELNEGHAGGAALVVPGLVPLEVGTGTLV